jgi:hypothetical protein
MITTSNGSSILDEKKLLMKKEKNLNNNNNPLINSQNLTCGDKSYTSSIHNNISYTNSLDHSHFKNNNFIVNNPRNYNNQYGTYNILHDNIYFYKNNIIPYDYKGNHKSQFKINFNDEKNILENLMLFVKDQNGCKLIQKKLEEKNNDFLSKFFEKVLYHFIQSN